MVFCLKLRNHKAFEITETELKLMAGAAIIGDSSQPVNGYSKPVASDIPGALYANAKPKFCFILATVTLEIFQVSAMPRRSPFTNVPLSFGYF